MGGSIEIFLDSGTSHVKLSLGKFYLFYLLIFPKNKVPEVKRGLRTLSARTLGHFGQRVDESPMYEDDFGVS